MVSNVALNAFCQGLFDESFVLGENGGTCIDENGALDKNMLDGDMARQEAEEERRRKILLLLMTTVEQEDQEQSVLDAKDRLRRNFERHQDE